MTDLEELGMLREFARWAFARTREALFVPGDGRKYHEARDKCLADINQKFRPYSKK